MEKLNQFFSELLTNGDKWLYFNKGASDTERPTNRKKMLDDAGINDAEEIISMNAKELQKLMERNVADSVKSEKLNHMTVCALILEHALKHPERIAIIDGKKHLTYQSLMQDSAAIASELIRRKVEPGSLVAVCMGRSQDLVVALLGVMRAGCAYIPLDPAYPQERVAYMLEHSGAIAAIIDNHHTSDLCRNVRELLWFDKVQAGDGPCVEPSGTDLAYVIYTSGSTGKPKAVAVEHRSVVAMTQSMRELLSDEELAGVLAAASVCFDTSVMEIMGTLSLGGTLIMAKNILEMPGLPAADRIRTCISVPSSMHALLLTEQLPEGILCFIFGGEALKHNLVEKIHQLKFCPRVINAYGPTEDTVYSTIAEIKPGTQMVTIGKSMLNSRSYILDDSMQPVAPGAAGELYLAGNKLARGYLHDDNLTRQRFIEVDVNALIPEKRLYKTGDLCRRLETGEIEFLGRIDQQVKIRGYRIELGEVESTLEMMPGVQAAAAVAVERAGGQKMLVVYAVSQHRAVTDAAVKQFLSSRLPQYMVPQLVKSIDSLPRLPNDKIDRKRLVQLVREDEQRYASNIDRSVIVPNDNVQQGGYASNLSVIQQELSALLAIATAREIAPSQSFERIGLDSLTTLEFCSRLGSRLGQRIPHTLVLEHATPDALARCLVHYTHDTDNEKDDRINSCSKQVNALGSLQSNLQSSHPTFQVAKAPSWCAVDKSRLVQEVMSMVNNWRRNPYSKVIRTGSAARGTVSDMYNGDEQEAIIWTTNLYLGLNRDPQVIDAASSAVQRFGTGMGTSAAASGLTDMHLNFETRFADLVGKEAACLFPTGYTANVGVVAGLLGNNDVVVIDQLCHASIVDGARLCGAKIRTFQHNNAADLEAVLQSEVSPYGSILVVLEGVYSMGEGAAPVADIVRMAKRYDALVLVDEAHSFGFYGEHGSGICAEQGVTEEVDFIMTTLSKALGSLGGVVAAKKEYVDLLRSSARAFIFQASVSPADIAAALTALQRLRTDDSLQRQLWDTTRYMRAQFEAAGYDLGTGDGPIVTPHFADKDKLFAIVQALYKRGVQTSAVTYPIVESGKGRLRFICSAAHTREDVDSTLAALIDAQREVEALTTHKQTHDISLNAEQVDVRLDVWLRRFVRGLTPWLAGKPEKLPDLGLSIAIPGAACSESLYISEGRVVHVCPSQTIAVCSLSLLSDEAMSTLCSFDVQGLMQSICEGSCELSGEVEPFVWFIARLVEQQNEGVPVHYAEGIDNHTITAQVTL